MSTGLKSPHRIRAVQALLLIVLMLGVFFRAAHLDGKLYWHDEVYTSVRTLGYTGDEIEEALFTGELTTRQDWLRYQQLDPERGWGDTLYALTTHPEHPPLFYLLLRGWVVLFGDSVAAIRSLSVVFSLLCFPALYWLCRELFDVRIWPVALALWSVSPVHVLYAQEARPYSLWTLMTLLSTAVLLWAMRSHRPLTWVTYGIVLAISAYTSLFTAMVWLSHGLYVGIQSWPPQHWQRSGKRSTPPTIGDPPALQHPPYQGGLGGILNWLLATGLAGFLFSPWIAVILVNRDRFQEKTSWVNFETAFPTLVKLWGLHISSVFIDLGLPLDHPYTYIAPALVLPLLGWALWVLCHNTPRRTWLLLVLMLVVPSAMLILPDVLGGGQRSINTRYFFPTLSTAVVVVAYLLAHLWCYRSRLAAGVMALVFTAGVLSCSLSASSNTWWNKGLSYHNIRTATVLNRLDRPIVVSAWSNNLLGNLVSMAYDLDDDVQLQIFSDTPLPPFPEDGRDRILFEFNDRLIESALANGFTLEGFEQDNVPLLRLVRQTGSLPDEGDEANYSNSLLQRRGDPGHHPS
ncbi:MAG: glycosyltransferase family 39 protein [Elainellaceae cyanobacterium]